MIYFFNIFKIFKIIYENSILFFKDIFFYHFFLIIYIQNIEIRKIISQFYLSIFFFYNENIYDDKN